MVFVSQPKRTDIYADRGIDCEEAIEPRFLEFMQSVNVKTFSETYLRKDLVSEAVAAGWKENEVDITINSLCVAHLAMLFSIDT